MTDTTEDLELFDDAKQEFPAKEDLKDRLVGIFVTGKHGQRKSAATGKMYDWYETITLVLDDGPDGTSFTDLVPSVAAKGEAIRLDNFQWSASGLASRLSARVTGDKPNTFKPLRGRINSQKNKQKGMADAWSIAEPTEEDKATSLKYADQVRKIMAELKAAQTTADEDAFE